MNEHGYVGSADANRTGEGDLIGPLIQPVTGNLAPKVINDHAGDAVAHSGIRPGADFLVVEGAVAVQIA